MLPERSVVSKAAKSVFFELANDIDVYIEDTGLGYEKIFVELLSRLFGKKFRISKVFPLGSRQSVIDQFRREKGRSGRPYLYIVDGDLFLLCGDACAEEKGLYTLPFYCIENILVDREAVHSLLNEEDPVRLRPELERDFDFTRWYDSNIDRLFDLFIEYAVSFRMNPTLQTVGFEVKNLVSSNQGILDPEKVALRMQVVRDACIAKVGPPAYEACRAEILAAADGRAASRIVFVSGKDYLLPLLKTRVRSTVKTNISDLNLKLRLAMRCSVDMITDIEAKIAHIPRMNR